MSRALWDTTLFMERIQHPPSLAKLARRNPNDRRMADIWSANGAIQWRGRKFHLDVTNQAIDTTRFSVRLHNIRSSVEAARMLRKFITRQKLRAPMEFASISAVLGPFGCCHIPEFGVPLVAFSDPCSRPWHRQRQRTPFESQTGSGWKMAGVSGRSCSSPGCARVEFGKCG